VTLLLPLSTVQTGALSPDALKQPSAPARPTRASLTLPVGAPGSRKERKENQPPGRGPAVQPRGEKPAAPQKAAARSAKPAAVAAAAGAKAGKQAADSAAAGKPPAKQKAPVQATPPPGGARNCWLINATQQDVKPHTCC
jgi:hypothetical protein